MTSRERPSRLDPDTTANLKRSREDAKPTRRARLVEMILFGVFALLILLGGLALWATYSPSYREVPNRIAQGIEDDRINVLVIGIGGKTHIGGGKDLADALMLASFRPSTGDVALLSIPRDLYVPIGRYGTHRINEAHRIGNQTAYPGRGPKLTMDTVSSILGIPVHGFIRIDFAGFEKIIDQIGGVDVYVERSFHDFLFDDGFEKGWQHLDGDRALRYARYRYVNDAEEGTTFGRERRQQQ
ncbi:MAG TPA: LCP family protein, partial [Thermoanaerobaculia bacterium]|nr:LCP family protein [Thermoanaerobaculia bacterium]